MNMDRFQELCAAYGAARHRWPEKDRPLFDPGARMPEGARALAEAARVDALLDAWSDCAQDTTLNARILAAARALPRRRAASNWISTAFAACAILGFAVGFIQGASTYGDAELYTELLWGSSVMEELQ